MKLLKMQQKFVLCRPVKNIIIKGNSNTGKREAMFHRILNMSSNFAYENEDKILVISKNNKDVEKLKDRFNKTKEREEYRYSSLLPSNTDIEFFSLNDIETKYANSMQKVTRSTQIKILKNIIKNNTFIKCKRLNENNVYLILNEIKYMKINKIQNEHEFLELSKVPLRFKKYSNERKEMYKLFEKYNTKLHEDNLYDDEDILIEAINNINYSSKYSHVFIDGAQNFNKLELQFLFNLARDKRYSTLNIIIDLDKAENIYSPIISKGKVHTKNIFNGKKRMFKFESLNENKNTSNDFIEEAREEYIYMDIKHKRNYEFVVMDNDSLVEEDETKYNEEQVVDIPVFSNIAAGEPILINPEVQDVFTLPKEWIRGKNKKFILKVKGDSMINANINNGDLVIIEQTPSPNNGEIVAVNIGGNATLKKLKVEKDQIVLLPENDNYKPIIINEMEEFYILGKAIGIITKKQ